MLPVALVHAAVWSFYRPLIDHSRADEFIPVTLVILGFISLYAQVYRYFRVASPLERQQLKWLVVGYTGLLCTSLLVVNPLNEMLTSRAGSMDPARALILSAIFDTLSLATTFFSSVAIVIAILRYRLWDVDILINRSLVYFTLVAVITGLYVLVVGSLSSLLQNQYDLAAPLAALLIIAAFVQPLRRALQQYVNRLLRFDPARRDESPVAVQKRSEASDETQEENLQIHAITEVDSSPHTRLHGRWLIIARLAWIAIAIPNDLLPRQNGAFLSKNISLFNFYRLFFMYQLQK